ncbi:MAG: alpha/beta hydrolase [Ruminococcaceae bacterium]|nr:alpha/beta hydrolase [Oscillospiraceae bacterium]
MKKSVKILTAVGCVALSAVIGFGGWRVYIRQQSKNYNLITLDTGNLPNPVSAPIEEADVELSEMTMHYALYGDKGHDLILVHGNGGSKKSLEEAARYLANDYKVYVIESRCHGQSSDPGVISYELMAKDIKEFCDKMKLDKPYLMGHSDGGINALTVAYTYPDLLGGFISCGANSVPEEFKPYFTVGVKVLDTFRPDKLNDMMLTLPDIDAEKLSKITCPAYIVAGEHDIMWLSDTVFIHENVRDSRIAIIKGANHSSYISQDGKQAYVLARDFFSELG